MSLSENIAADQSAVDAAQTALDAAKAQLAADQAALDATVPHLNLWQEVEAYAATLGTEVESTIKSFSDRAKTLLGM